MKILLCADDKSANTLAWAKGFREFGAEVLIASVRAEKDSDGIVSIGNTRLPARLNFLSTRRLRRLISTFKPDILIGYRVTSYGYLCSCAGFHPLVLAAQNEQITYLPKPNPIRKKLLEFFAKRAIARADLIHVWGENMVGRLKELGADERKILVLHRGIDLGIFSPPAGKPGYREPVFISSRALFPEYKIDMILEAFSMVLEKMPGAKLKVMGDGPEKGKLMGLADRYRISGNVEFSGRLTPGEVASALRNSDIYVSIIESEGVSSSLVEALACGVYPIVTDMPASRALIENGKNGTFVRPDTTISSLAETMVKAAENKSLRETAATINIKLTNDKFDFRKNTAKFLDAYGKLASLKI